jgi:hypothetical protein
LVISDLVSKTEHPLLKRRLNLLWVKTAALVEIQQEKRNRAGREALRTAAMICQKLRDDDHNVIKLVTALNKSLCTNTKNMQQCQDSSEKLNRFRNMTKYNLGFYADAVLDLVHNYPLDVLDTEKALLLADLEQRTYKGFMSFVKVLYEHVSRYSANEKQNRDGWYEDCVAVPFSDQ